MSIALSATDKLTIISNLATMIASGIPILEAVDSMLEDAKANQRKILLTLKQDLSEGKTIASSLEKFPRSFDHLTVSLIRAAEEAGTLETTLSDLAENIKKDIELSDKVRAALIYPILVLFVFFGVMLLILIVVIPRVATVFSRLQVKLPLPTKILIFASNLLLSYWPYLLVGVALLVFLSIIIYRIKRQYFIYIFLSLPLVTSVAREFDLVRFTRSMSLLLSSGIVITQALELSEKMIFKKEIAKIVRISKEKVTSGKKLAEGFKESKKLIPPVMIRLIEAGEKSGTLEKSMLDLSTYFDARVTSSLKNLTTLLEPLLLLIIGLFVGGIMMAIVAPIYQLIGQIRTR